MSELRDELPDDELPLYCPLTEMAIFIATRIQPQGEPFRATNDKVRKRMIYATTKGHLKTVGVDLYHVSQTIAWVQEKWPGKFDDLFAESSGTATATAVMSDEVEGWVIPGDLLSCREALEQTHRENQRLRTELKAARAEIEHLKPIAMKYEHIREKNTQSAKLPRNGKL